VLSAVAASPAKMQRLAVPRVRNAVLASRDQARAVDMMLREGSGSPETMLDDARAAWEGRISPVLIWDKHPMVVAGLAFAVLIVLLMLRRLFRPRRRRTPPSAPPSSAGPNGAAPRDPAREQREAQKVPLP
jgi:hypothetical protein